MISLFTFPHVENFRFVAEWKQTNRQHHEVDLLFPVRADWFAFIWQLRWRSIRGLISEDWLPGRLIFSLPYGGPYGSSLHSYALLAFGACSICSSLGLFSYSRALSAIRVPICSSHALISIPRALFAVRTLYLQFACSTFSFACSISSSHALFSFSRALFAVRVLYFQFGVVYLQFACSIFSSRTPFAVRVLHLQFACSNFHYACSICSSSVLYLQHSCSGFLLTFSSCNSCVLIFSHFLIQLARSTEQSARYCFCTWLFVADCGTWIKLCVWSGFNMANSGPAEGEGLGGGLQPPHFFGNFKELLRKRCFQPPHPPFWVTIQPPHFQSSSAGPVTIWS